jgi:hypothetical protein
MPDKMNVRKASSEEWPPSSACNLCIFGYTDSDIVKRVDHGSTNEFFLIAHRLFFDLSPDRDRSTISWLRPFKTQSSTIIKLLVEQKAIQVRCELFPQTRLIHWCEVLMKSLLNWLKGKLSGLLPKKKKEKKPANATYPLW